MTPGSRILRNFLTENGLVPRRYGVSDAKTRVSSPTGHISAEMDIVLFDPDNAISLMRREGGYQVLPIESVYGVIQVKSRLNKNEIRDGLENIASFKALDKIEEPRWGFIVVDENKSSRGFGILFAYDTDLEWIDVIREIELFARSHENKVWCNGIYILKKGFFLHGDGRSAYKLNPHLAGITELQMHGYPDRLGICLYDFLASLLLLITMTEVSPPNIDRYFRLPFVSGDRSYEFTLGMYTEIGRCPQHGDFARKISAANLKKVVDFCRPTKPMNWIQATDIAYGRAGDNYSAYERQPGDVFIYNPNGLPLNEILVAEMDMEDGMKMAVNAFDIIATEGMTIYIPLYYTATDGIISGCPQCKRPKLIG